MKIKYTLAALAATSMAANAAVVYNAAADGLFTGTAGWSLDGAESASVVGGVTTTLLNDDNGNALPTASYAYSGIDTDAEAWNATLTMNVVFGNGSADNVFQVFDSDSVGRWLGFIYENGAGDIIFNDLVTITNLGANDDALHTFSYTADDSGNVEFSFDGGAGVAVNFRAADGAGAGGARLDIGGGSSSGTGALNVSQVEIGAVPEPSSAALLGLGGLALILRRRK